MSSSTRTLRFLLDENVRIELFRFLKSNGFDARRALRSSTDAQLAGLSNNENRILVTNDADFTSVSPQHIFSVIWLRIPQNDPVGLIRAFRSLIKEKKDFEKKLIVLWPRSWEAHPLGRRPELI